MIGPGVGHTGRCIVKNFLCLYHSECQVVLIVDAGVDGGLKESTFVGFGAVQLLQMLENKVEISDPFLVLFLLLWLDEGSLVVEEL